MDARDNVGPKTESWVRLDNWPSKTQPSKHAPEESKDVKNGAPNTVGLQLVQ